MTLSARGPLGPLAHGELDGVAFAQIADALAINGALMEEIIFFLVSTDDAILVSRCLYGPNCSTAIEARIFIAPPPLQQFRRQADQWVSCSPMARHKNYLLPRLSRPRHHVTVQL